MSDKLYPYNLSQCTKLNFLNYLDKEQSIEHYRRDYFIILSLLLIITIPTATPKRVPTKRANIG